MPLPSYSDVFNLDHERPHHEDIHEGDVVPELGQSGGGRQTAEAASDDHHA